MTEATTCAADHYVQRLDLGADPFAPDYRTDYFYSGAMRRQLLDQLIHFGRFSDQLTLLVGATGSGSSTLLDAMLTQLQPVMDCCIVNAEWAPVPEQLLASLSEQLQLESQGSAESASEFLAALQSTVMIDGEPEPVLIAIDQAHYLALESVELLRWLYEQAGGGIHLLLVGEYQIEQLSKLAGFDSEQQKLLELEPLTASEVGDYLLGVLRSAGYAGDQPLSSDQLAVLHEQSGGNIAEVRQLLPALLVTEADVNNRNLGFKIPFAHIAAVVILVVALLASYFYQGADDAPEVISELIPESAPVVIAASNTDVVVAPVPDSQAGKQVKNTLPAQAGNSVPALPATSLSSDGNSSTAERLTIDSSGELSAQSGQVDRQPSSTSGSSERVVVQSESIDSAVKVTPVVQSKPKPKPKPEPEPEPEPKPKPVAESAVAERVTSSASKKPAMTAAAEKAIPARERRLLSLPADVYMLQLLGSVDEGRVRGFVKQYVGRLPVTYFETTRNAKPWFVALTGPYDDRADALAGIKVLPPELQKQKPWARSVAGVQKDIRKNH